LWRAWSREGRAKANPAVDEFDKRRRRNFFDTHGRAVSLRTLFAGTKWSHGRSNCKV
jgi:hypothetical protein